MPPRPSVLKKYVLSAEPRVTKLEAKELPVSSTGYVALRDKAARLVIGLKKLESNTNMSFVDWDGMCVPIFSPELIMFENLVQLRHTHSR
jgi:hypothetical protein